MQITRIVVLGLSMPWARDIKVDIDVSEDELRMLLRAVETREEPYQIIAKLRLIRRGYKRTPLIAVYLRKVRRHNPVTNRYPYLLPTEEEFNAFVKDFDEMLAKLKRYVFGTD